jgi:hypothetical protein
MAAFVRGSAGRDGHCTSIGPLPARSEVEEVMLWTIFVILLVLWLLGLVSAYTMGGFIHILLIIAIAVLCIQLFTGRRAV